MKTVMIGMLGCGNVGTGVLRLLADMEADIARRFNLRVAVKKILVRDAQKQRDAAVPRDRLTTVAEDVLQDPEIALAVECMGGEEPSAALMRRALENGKIVVTANKMALAQHFDTLIAAARRARTGLFFEAAVCGAIPVIRTLEDSLQGNRVDTIMGIVNGTTNYILTRMTDEGLSYAQALAQAQALGLAEPDPSADVDGLDAAYKLAILSSLAFHTRLPLSSIYAEGIRDVCVEDIQAGRELGYRLKLLAVGKREGSAADVRVHPAFIPERHPLASVQGAFNAVFLHGSACGDMMLYGQGAGSAPTAGAIVSDVLYALTRPRARLTPGRDAAAKLAVTDNWTCGYYIRFSAANRPGVLGHIATVLGSHGVSISSLLQRKAESEEGVPILVITHRAIEKDVRAAISRVDTRIAQVQSAIRVEGFE